MIWKKSETEACLLTCTFASLTLKRFLSEIISVTYSEKRRYRGKTFFKNNTGIVPFIDTQKSFNISYHGSVPKLFSYIVAITKIRVDPGTSRVVPFEVVLLYKREAIFEALHCTEGNHL